MNEKENTKYLFITINHPLPKTGITRIALFWSNKVEMKGWKLQYVAQQLLRMFLKSFINEYILVLNNQSKKKMLNLIFLKFLGWSGKAFSRDIGFWNVGRHDLPDQFRLHKIKCWKYQVRL